MATQSKKYLITQAIYQLQNVNRKTYGFDIERFYNTLKENARLLYKKRGTPIEHKHLISMIHDGLENTLMPSNRWPTESQIKVLIDAFDLLKRKNLSVHNLEDVSKDLAHACIYTPPHKNQLGTKPQQPTASTTRA